ncbi:MAG TPA: hypothetical protein VEP90_05970 [Methylomirabilota bacterium]|nr:hypothetical protein [Methylomirabilota bacterium]
MARKKRPGKRVGIPTNLIGYIDLSSQPTRRKRSKGMPRWGTKPAKLKDKSKAFVLALQEAMKKKDEQS